MDVVETFLQLVSIPSPSGEEKKIGTYIYSQLKPLVDTIKVDTAGNIYATKKGVGKNSLLLCAHMDTVRPAGKEAPIIENDIIRAGGKYVLGADNKSAVAAILTSLFLINKEQSTHAPLEILITVREETDSGIKDFNRKKLQSRHALLADKSNPIGDVQVSAPFVMGYAMKVEAPGGHVSFTMKKTPHPLRFLEQFMKQMPYGRLSVDTVVNIAIVKMGESYNSIPQVMEFTGEIRTFNKKSYESFKKKLSEVTKQLDKTIGTQSKLILYPYCTGYNLINADTVVIKKTMKQLGFRYKAIKAFGVGDFNILSEWGIRPVNIGTGEEDVHTTRERIAIDDLRKLEQIFFHYIQNFS